MSIVLNFKDYFQLYRKYEKEEETNEKAFMKVIEKFLEETASTIENQPGGVIKNDQLINLLRNINFKWIGFCKKLISYRYPIDRADIEKQTNGKKTIKWEPYRKYWQNKIYMAYRVLIHKQFPEIKKYWRY